jgi:hypothetical protein
MKILIKVLLPILTFQILSAQKDSTGLTRYTPECKFKEGIYINFDQVKTNSPLPKSRIISTYDYNDQDFFDKILIKSSVNYYDHLGNSAELKTKNIWGYCRNGFIYVKKDDGYFRITLIGSICHFIADLTVYNNYNSPYYNNYYYYDPYRMGPSTSTSTEMHQYLLDFNTGRILDYNEASLEVLLMQDPELHDEYSALSRKKKKQMKFIYIRKFNERNPLYLPQN